MQIRNVIIGSYRMEMVVEFANENVSGECLSSEYRMEGIAKFQIKTIITCAYENSRTGSITPNQKWIFVKLDNITNNTSIYMKLSSKLLNVKDMCINADSKWHSITDKYVSILKFDIDFTVDLQSGSVNKLKVLYGDELTDFELRGDDGTVKVHKVMLSATSPMLQTMLRGDWKETIDGYIDLNGISRATLQDFKQFIYLNTLPPAVSEEILIIAMRYEIPDMETVGIKNLIERMKAENVRDLLDFAITHKCDKLIVAILECVQHRFIKVDDIKKSMF